MSKSDIRDVMIGPEVTESTREREYERERERDVRGPVVVVIVGAATKGWKEGKEWEACC